MTWLVLATAVLAVLWLAAWFVVACCVGLEMDRQAREDELRSRLGYRCD